MYGYESPIPPQFLPRIAKLFTSEDTRLATLPQAGGVSPGVAPGVAILSKMDEDKLVELGNIKTEIVTQTDTKNLSNIKNAYAALHYAPFLQLVTIEQQMRDCTQESSNSFTDKKILDLMANQVAFGCFPTTATNLQINFSLSDNATALEPVVKDWAARRGIAEILERSFLSPEKINHVARNQFLLDLQFYGPNATDNLQLIKSLNPNQQVQLLKIDILINQHLHQIVKRLHQDGAHKKAHEVISASIDYKYEILQATIAFYQNKYQPQFKTRVEAATENFCKQVLDRDRSLPLKLARYVKSAVLNLLTLIFYVGGVHYFNYKYSHSVLLFKHTKSAEEIRQTTKQLLDEVKPSRPSH